MAVEEKVVSREFKEYIRKPVTDIGLDETVKNLSPEKIEKAINAVLNLRKSSARLAAPLETCIHCALCSNACHWYLSHDKDPTYSPVAKVRMTLWEMIKRKGKVSSEFIKQCARIAFCECNLCRRCSMYCPFGLDIAYQMGMVRRICYLLGLVPQMLMDFVNSLSATSNQLWLTQADWIDTMQWQEEEARMEIKNARIPIEKEGADVMWITIGTEPKIATYHIARITKMMNVAGIDWTVPAADGWDHFNAAMFARDLETMQKVVRGLFDNALRLRVKRIVANECGHAITATTSMAPPLLGWKGGPALPLETLHAVEFYYELVSTGKIKIDKKKKIKGPVTIQDPCNLVRLRGAGEKIRYLLRETVDGGIIEMYPNREHNFCCNAGGGLIASGAPWKGNRCAGNHIKAEQIRATGCHTVVTPCHNCYVGINDIIKYYNLDGHAKFLDEIINETMEIPDDMKAGG
ncbi:MAG: (Fe-S)-binding protein [Nitrospirota bacterium]